jgi:hypothetical protein
MGSQRPWIGQQPPLDARPQPPRHRPRAGVHPVLLHPVGGEGPRRGDEGATRAACLVSHPDQPPGPFALTPTLSHSHPGSASRKSFGGRGGDARRCRWVSRRSSSPTDERSVESGAPAGQAWRLPCGLPSNMDRPTPLRPQPKTPVREDPSTGWRGGGPLCPLRWTWIKRKRIVGQPGIMDRPRDRPGENRLSASERHASRPCPEGTFLDSPGFERSSTLGCVPVQTISPEGAGLNGVSGETVGRMLACFGGGAGHCHVCSNRTLRQANPHGVQRSF